MGEGRPGGGEAVEVDEASGIAPISGRVAHCASLSEGAKLCSVNTSAGLDDDALNSVEK